MREVLGTIFVVVFDILTVVFSYWMFEALPVAVACILAIILVLSAVVATCSVLKYWKGRVLK